MSTSPVSTLKVESGGVMDINQDALAKAVEQSHLLINVNNGE